MAIFYVHALCQLKVFSRYNCIHLYMGLIRDIWETDLYVYCKFFVSPI